MYGFKKSPLHRLSKHSSVDPPLTRGKVSDPFDSSDDDQLDDRNTSGSKGFTSASSKQSLTYAQKNKYKNEFRESGGLESQTVEELESYAVYKSEETTNTVNNCVRIAEDMRGQATETLITLHHQREQITRTHMAVTDIDHGLSRGEKLLGSLGGMFSKTWKPKSRKLTGPVIERDDPLRKRANHLEQKERLGIAPAPNGPPKSRTTPPEPTNALQKVEYEKAKQDEALSDLSNILEEMKEMAIDMRKEIDWGTGALGRIDKDVDELNIGVNNANKQGLRLLGK